jgi:hypothetical protein
MSLEFTRTQLWTPFARDIIGLAGKRPLCKGWTTWQGNTEYMETLATRGHNFGLLAANFPAVDIDITAPMLAQVACELATEIIGAAPTRTRGGASKCLLMYAAPPGGLRKRRLEFTTPDGVTHAVELLATGQQYVVDGQHPDGGAYDWSITPDPWDLLTITGEQWDAFARTLADRLTRILGPRTITKDGLGGAALAARTREQSSLLAPNPAEAVRALQEWRDRRREGHAEHMPHDDFVQLCAAFRGSVGDLADELFEDFRELCPAGRDTDDNTHKTYHSFGDVALGWSRLCEITDYVPATSFATPVDEDALPDDPQEKELRKMRARFLYVEASKRFYDRERNALWDNQQFDALNKGVAPYGCSGRSAAHAIALNDHALTRVHTATYRPGAPQIIEEERDGKMVSCVNRWRPATLAPLAPHVGDVSPWLAHGRTLFDDYTLNALLDWMAFTVQHAAVKIQRSPVIYSPVEGNGKDTFIKPLKMALGLHNVATIDPEDLFAGFNPWIEHKLVVINEVHTFGRREFMNKIKRYLASPPEFLTLNQKNEKAYNIPNIMNVVMFTNHGDALAPSENDRRLWVIECKRGTAPMTPAEANRLYDWYDGGGYAAIAHFLGARDISRFDPNERAPMTGAKAAMIEDTRDPGEQWMANLFEDGGPLVDRTVLAWNEIPAPAYAKLRRGAVRGALKAKGFELTDFKVRDGGTVTALWTRRIGQGRDLIEAAWKKERAA